MIIIWMTAVSITSTAKSARVTDWIVSSFAKCDFHSAFAGKSNQCIKLYIPYNNKRLSVVRL